MTKMLKFIFENIKNISVIVVFLGGLFVLCVRLYSTPDRVDTLEENVRVLQTKQEMFDLRFNNLEQNVQTFREDLKEMKQDIKLLLSRER